MPRIQRGATPFTRKKAKELRTRPSVAVATLWGRLRGRQVSGWKFRQRPTLLGSIPAFWCPEARLTVDVGADTTDRARRRDTRYHAAGIRVLRFSAKSVQTDIDAVISYIAAALDLRRWGPEAHDV